MHKEDKITKVLTPTSRLRTIMMEMKLIRKGMAMEEAKVATEDNAEVMDAVEILEKSMTNLKFGV